MFSLRQVAKKTHEKKIRVRWLEFERRELIAICSGLTLILFLLLLVWLLPAFSHYFCQDSIFVHYHNTTRHTSFILTWCYRRNSIFWPFKARSSSSFCHLFFCVYSVSSFISIKTTWCRRKRKIGQREKINWNAWKWQRRGSFPPSF